MAIYSPSAASRKLRANDCHFLGEGEIGGAENLSAAVIEVETKTRLCVCHRLFQICLLNQMGSKGCLFIGKPWIMNTPKIIKNEINSLTNMSFKLMALLSQSPNCYESLTHAKNRLERQEMAGEGRQERREVWGPQLKFMRLS